MEERDLGGVHTSGSWGDDHFDHRHVTGLGRGLSSVGQDDLLKIEHGGIGKDHSEFLFEDGFEALELGHGFTELGEEFVVFHILVERRSSQGEGFLHDSVLTNDQMGSIFVQIFSDLLNLVGRHIVQRHEDNALVGGEAFIDSLDEIVFFNLVFL